MVVVHQSGGNQGGVKKCRELNVRFVPNADILHCSKERRYSGNSLVRPAHMLQIELQIEYRVGWTAKDGRYHVP